MARRGEWNTQTAWERAAGDGMSATAILCRWRVAAPVAEAPGEGGALVVDIDGVTQPLTSCAPDGVYPDGSARALNMQFTSVQSMTAGTPLPATLTLPSGTVIPLEAHRFASGSDQTDFSHAIFLPQGALPAEDFAAATFGTWEDDSASWENDNVSTWYTSGAGIPDGVLSPTDPAFLCAASPVGNPTPMESQPTFDGSAATDSALLYAVTNTILTWNGVWPYGPAQYERPVLLYHLYCRTADVSYLRIALAHAARMRSALWATHLTGLAEWQQDYDSWLLLVLFRRDRVLLGNNDGTGLMFIASNVFQYGPAGVGTWFHAENARFATARIKAVTAVIKAGRGNEQNQYETGTYIQMGQALVVEGLATGTDKMTQANGRITLIGYADDGVTQTRTVYPYMLTMYAKAMRELLAVLPPSANVTAMFAQLSASLLWMRENMQCTSGTGTRNYLYQDVDVWYPAVGGELTSNYTSGSTSISIAIDIGGTPPDGWPASGYFSAGCVVRIGSVSKRIAAPFTTDESGHATVTLEAGGFASGYSGGQAITFMRDAAVGVSADNVDLNGFIAPELAWRGSYESSSEDTEESKLLWASLGLTPRDGVTGPYLSSGKQCDEGFSSSQLTLAAI